MAWDLSRRGTCKQNKRKSCGDLFLLSHQIAIPALARFGLDGFRFRINTLIINNMRQLETPEPKPFRGELNDARCSRLRRYFDRSDRNLAPSKLESQHPFA
jgi:hypothetical protein